MKFLADESCDFSVVRILRHAGYEVLAVSEISPSAEDLEVIQLALQEKRILLTEDKDFGQLVYAHGQKIHAVVFIRYPGAARKKLARDILRLTKLHGQKLIGCFVVVEPGRIRFSRP